MYSRFCGKESQPASDSKCELYNLSGADANVNHLKVSDSGTSVLRMPIGTQEYIYSQSLC